MSDKNACVCCDQTALSGSATGGEVDRWIECYQCNRWSHIDCFEGETHTEGAVTPRLWESRDEFIQPFRFTCSKCGAATSIPAQIEAQGLLSRQMLTDLGVNSKSLAAIETLGAVGGAPPPIIQPTVVAPPTATADFQSIMNMVMAAQEKAREQESLRQEKIRAEESLRQEKIRAEENLRQEKIRAEERAERERIEAARIKSEERREAEREKTRSEEKADRERLLAFYQSVHEDEKAERERIRSEERAERARLEAAREQDRREERETMQTLLKQKQDAEELRVGDLERLFESVQTSTPPTSEAKSNSGGLRLPELKLPTFGGDALKWPEFWDIFRAMIDQNRGLSDVQKLSHLRANLSGPAKDMVSSLSMTDDNYEIAVTILKSRFGDPFKIKGQLLSQLENLPRCSMKFPELQQQFFTVEKILKQLQNLKATLDGDLFWKLLAGKFPAEVNMKQQELTVNIGERYVDWTVETYLQSLERVVKRQEIEFEFRNQGQFEKSRPTSSPGISQQPSSSGAKGSSFFRPRSSADAMVSIGESRKSKRNFVPISHSNSKNLGGRPSGSSNAKAGGSQTRRYPCVFCQGDHFPDECTKYTTVEQRKTRLEEKNRCYMCLRDNHFWRDCPSPWKTRPCKGCQNIGHHHYSLCREWIAKKNPTTVKSTGAVLTTASGPGSSRDSAHSEVNIEASYSVLSRQSAMQTAEVKVMNRDKQKTGTARIFLDSGSTISWMSKSFARSMGFDSENPVTFKMKAFQTKPKTIEGFEVEMDLLVPTHKPIRCEFMVVDQLSIPIQYPSLSPEDCVFLDKNRYRYPMAAGSVSSSSEVFKADALVGQDYFWSIVENSEKIELPSGLILLPTKFGYMLAGKNSVKGKSSLTNAGCVNTYFTQSFTPYPQLSQYSVADKSIAKNLNVEDLWDLDRIGISDSPTINDDDKALERFNETIKFDEGRYHATWMWKSDKVDLPTNYDMALRRFQSLIKRFKEDPEILEKYSAILEEQLQKGIIEKVTGDTEKGPREHYLPHHAVVTPLKETTKVRIVYDASARSNKHSKSLNDCLYRGPVMLSDLCGLLMRYRTYPTAVLADIEKAFLQIGLQVPDRDVTRFLWLREPGRLDLDGGKNIQIYRFCRVAFGIICSPSILEATIKYHLTRIGTPVALRMADNIYVDNVLVGGENSDEALQVYTEAKEIFSKASMNLREWTSNSTKFMESIPGKDRAKSEKPIIKVLGLKWDLVTDQIQIAGSNSEAMQMVGTKREALHVFAQIFDPLGYFSPVTLHGKLYLEKLWKLNKPWDECLPEELKIEWQSVANTLTDIGSVRRPRFLGTNSSITDYQLMVFCDASTKAYGIAVYLRFYSGDQYQTHLIFSKNRLPPKVKDKNKELRATSLPRLELLGVYIGVKAAEFVRHELRLPISQTTVWTDSECVLHWIKSSKPLSVFVENRLHEIRKPKNINFRYVKSEDNPADLTTRGRTVAEIKDDSLWWHGPTWLAQPVECWPSTNIPELTPEILESINKEIKGEISLFVGGDPAGQNSTKIPAGGVSKVIDATRFSKLRKLLGVTCYCLRFLKQRIWNRLSAETKSKLSLDFLGDMESGVALSAKELDLAENLWIKSVQRISYADVFSDIQSKKRNDLRQQLGLRVDPSGFLRCCGRLGNADLRFEAKYPRILPGKSHFTRLVVEDNHRRLYHVGVSHTLSQIRMRFWIPQGRKMVGNILSKCLVCRRHSGGPFKLPPMPQLPRERVSRSRPFQVVGIDYMGPFYCKEENREVRKLWICLFTCLTVRAIHLELVRGLDAQEFVDCFRRFVSRYGKPDRIISDNAPTFKLADKILDSIWSRVVSDPDTVEYFTSERIEWTFITEFAPWQGGFYERLVGVVKRSLRKALGRKFFTERQLNTIVHEIEAVVNSRPLTFVYNEVDGGMVLSPSDLLGFAKSRVGFPQIEMDHSDPEYLPKLDSTQQLVRYLQKAHKKLDQFWDTWQREYLLSLRERYQIEHKNPRVNIPSLPEIGDVVLLKEENIPRNSWKLVRVTEVFPRSDGEVTRVRIRTSSGKELDRPVNSLCPLELPSKGTPECALDKNPEEMPTGREGNREGACGPNSKEPLRPSSKEPHGPYTKEPLWPPPVPVEKRRPTRRAAEEAKQRIHEQLTELE